MHSMGVIHRDIKAENVLIGDDVVAPERCKFQKEPKLCDFGWSVHCETDTRNTICGTVEYIPPEICKGDRYSYSVEFEFEFDGQADLWSLGILTYELCTGKTPYAGTTVNEIEQSIQMSAIHFPDSMTSICQDFISNVVLMTVWHVVVDEKAGRSDVY